MATIFPLMEGAEFDDLVADIKAYGQHARIVLKDGMILDGRNRYRACRKLGIEPFFVCKAYSDQIIDPAAYVISANIRRGNHRASVIASLHCAGSRTSRRVTPAGVGFPVEQMVELTDWSDWSDLDRLVTEGLQELRSPPTQFTAALRSWQARPPSVPTRSSAAAGEKPYRHSPHNADRGREQ